jgi:hypothetical protein
LGEDIFETFVIGEDIATIAHQIVSPNLEGVNNRY